jgi:hypothetical protein
LAQRLHAGQRTGRASPDTTRQAIPADSARLTPAPFYSAVEHGSHTQDLISTQAWFNNIERNM